MSVGYSVSLGNGVRVRARTVKVKKSGGNNGKWVQLHLRGGVDLLMHLRAGDFGPRGGLKVDLKKDVLDKIGLAKVFSQNVRLGDRDSTAIYKRVPHSRFRFVAAPPEPRHDSNFYPREFKHRPLDIADFINEYHIKKVPPKRGPRIIGL